MRTAGKAQGRRTCEAERLRERGFTLLELTIALTLLALLSAVLFGSLRLAGRSTDSGEAKVEAAASMRLTQDFLRTNLEAQHPLRMRKILEWPLLFRGTRNELRYTSDLPPRVAGGGIWFYRLASAINELRDRGLLAYHLKDFPAALRDLQAYLQLTSSAPLDNEERQEHEQIWEHVKTLRKRVASLN